MALYIILYGGYTLYERFVLRKTTPHFVPVAEIDFVSDAVWEPGQGAAVREEDAEISEKMKAARGQNEPVWRRVTRWAWL